MKNVVSLGLALLAGSSFVDFSFVTLGRESSSALRPLTKPQSSAWSSTTKDFAIKQNSASPLTFAAAAIAVAVISLAGERARSTIIRRAEPVAAAAAAAAAAKAAGAGKAASAVAGAKVAGGSIASGGMVGGDASRPESGSAPDFDPATEVGALPPLGFFDPLGFSKKGDLQGFRNLRVAEIKHARVAMMASIGAVTQHYVKFPGFEGVPAGLAAVTVVPGSIGFAVLFVAAGIMETTVWAEDINKEPGNFGDPAGFGQYTTEMRNKELNNGRMGMFASLGIIAADLLTGKDGVQQLGL
jgi:hypothetical protein